MFLIIKGARLCDVILKERSTVSRQQFSLLYASCQYSIYINSKKRRVTTRAVCTEV